MVEQPRISVNKLGEYTIANPTRRRAIVTAQAKPSDFIVARYRHARRALQEFFLAGASDFDALERAAEEIATHRAGSDWDREDRALSAQAIRSFIELAPDLDLRGLHAEEFDLATGKVLLGGVTVSVQPDVLLRGTYRKKTVIGAVKFHISKLHTLDDVALSSIAAMQHHLLEEASAQHQAHPARRVCLAIDVFSGKVARSPRTYVRRLRTLEAACEEIALRWASVSN